MEVPTARRAWHATRTLLLVRLAVVAAGTFVLVARGGSQIASSSGGQRDNPAAFGASRISNATTPAPVAEERHAAR